MLDALKAEKVREIAALAKEARAAQDRLLNKMRIVDRFDDHKELTGQTAETLDALDATLENQALTQLRRRIEALDREGRLELAAVALLGRGDFAAGEWAAALDEARARGDANDPDSLARKPDLAEYLGKGLFQLGVA